jgi:hypothetical protein
MVREDCEEDVSMMIYFMYLDFQANVLFALCYSLLISFLLQPVAEEKRLRLLYKYMVISFFCRIASFVVIT